MNHLYKNHKLYDENRDPVFFNNGFLDVTYFEIMTPDEPIGYARNCTVAVFQSGLIEMRAIDKDQSVLESFNISDILMASNNINNCDPRHINEVSLITHTRDYRITFHSLEEKRAFWSALTTTYNKLHPEL